MVLLTKFQVGLYRKKVADDVKPPGKSVSAAVDAIVYTALLGLMLLCCRSLLLLAYFHDFDRQSLEIIRFVESKNGVLMILDETRKT